MLNMMINSVKGSIILVMIFICIGNFYWLYLGFLLFNKCSNVGYVIVLFSFLVVIFVCFLILLMIVFGICMSCLVFCDVWVCIVYVVLNMYINKNVLVIVLFIVNRLWLCSIKKLLLFKLLINWFCLVGFSVMFL